ncbi:AMP-binding protein [Niallia sp. XMNu-256]|uniref:AMP-binding protein n=1 Tax=Niallia sp. XMNu-256 TaxID=3082444 RepID=UPI0030D499B9
MRVTSPYQKYAKKFPNQPAVITDEKVVSYREWHEDVQRAAAALSTEEAVTKRVALFLPNGYLFLQLFAGACEAGWANIVGDIRWKEGEIAERLQQTTPDLIIADVKMKPIFQTYREKVLYSDEVENWLDKGREWTRGQDNAPFYIGFTSGSTGKPKAFVRSQKSWVESFPCNTVDIGIEPGDHALIPGSFISSTFLFGALGTLFYGGTIYVLKKFNPSQFMSHLQTFPISTIYVVPTMLQALIEAGHTYDGSVRILSTGAKWLPSTKQEMRKRFPNASFYEFYGSSELSYVTLLKNEEQHKFANSVGRAFHNVELSIRNQHGQEVEVGEEGILYVKSKMLFDGYINNEEETNKVLQGEWATVYDVAKRDEDGYFYILGRQNDMILYGGINIYPQEIEQVLKKCEGVEEAVVLGVKDEHWGEKVAACIKGNVSLDALKRYCLEHLTSYKVPRLWKKTEVFPYTTGGKISRQEVRKWFC